MAFPVFPVLALLGAGALLFGMGGEKTAKAAPAGGPQPLPPQGPRIPVFVPPFVPANTNEDVDQKLRLAIARGDLKTVVDAALATQDPVKVWELANSIDRVARSGGSGSDTAQLQAAASLLRMQAVEMALRQGTLDSFLARGIARGETATLAQTVRLVAARNPAQKDRLTQIADQLERAPGVLAGTAASPPIASDQAVAQQAAQAAAQVMADAIKQTGVILQPTGAGLPASSSRPSAPTTAPVITSTSPGLPSIVPQILPTVAPTVFTPPMVVTAPSVPALDAERVRRAQAIRDHLRNSMRYKEDRGRVKLFQTQEGLKADGMYGPATATAIGKLGVVPVVPFYWTKATAVRDKQVYKENIAKLSAMFPHLDWSEAINGGGPKNHPSVDRS